jgi:hypothetical protein
MDALSAKFIPQSRSFCQGQATPGIPASIESIVGSNDTEELILSWYRGFRADELTVEDIQDRFATLDVSGIDLAHAVRKRIGESQRELDAIRWGMCEAGQRAEIGRIFAELERLLARNQAK